MAVSWRIPMILKGSGTRRVDRKSLSGLEIHVCLCDARGLSLRVTGHVIKRIKGIWWMPWHQEAMKDVARCEKPRGAASRL